jgi:protein-arginine kinase activator protein McsA
MKDDLREEVNCLAQTINKKKRLLFQKIEKEEFEYAAQLRDEINTLQKEMLEILNLK